MTTAQIKIPKKLIPVFSGNADVRGAHGGRGSGKTRSFALMSAVKAYKFAQEGREGLILCGRQFMNTLDDSSLEEIKAAISSKPWLAEHFDIGEKYVRTKCGRVRYAFTGLDRNINSVKSKSRILVCWVDEAEAVTESAWTVLLPTIREDESELWVTWNPERENSATDTRFRKTKDSRYKVVELNWRDNPKFPARLERERLRDKKNNPDQYDHIWEGGYKKVVEGAYFARHLSDAREQGRLGTEDKNVHVPVDPLLTIRLFADIGGTGAKADNFVFWVGQFAGPSIHWIDHYEVQGQQIGHHLNWLRAQEYTSDKAQIWLPHDGSTNDRVYDVSYESAFRKAGYTVTVIPNQGTGAAMQRIETVRNNFHRMRFDDKCRAGVDAISFYHEKKDEIRQIGLGPNHDWSSHSADALGLGALCYDEPTPKKTTQRRSSGSWRTR